MAVLEQEIQTYNSNLSALLERDEGKFVLIQGAKVAGTYASFDAAVEQGYEKFSLEAFLVKQIQAVEQVHFVIHV